MSPLPRSSDIEKAGTDDDVSSLLDWMDLIGRLPAESQQLVDLRFRLDMSWPEIAIDRRAGK